MPTKRRKFNSVNDSWFFFLQAHLVPWSGKLVLLDSSLKNTDFAELSWLLREDGCFRVMFTEASPTAFCLLHILLVLSYTWINNLYINCGSDCDWALHVGVHQRRGCWSNPFPPFAMWNIYSYSPWFPEYRHSKGCHLSAHWPAELAGCKMGQMLHLLRVPLYPGVLGGILPPYSSVVSSAFTGAVQLCTNPNVDLYFNPTI